MSKYLDIVDEEARKLVSYMHPTWPTEQAMRECIAVDAAYHLIGDPRRRPYAADPELKALRAEAKGALRELSRALHGKAFAALDAERSTR